MCDCLEGVSVQGELGFVTTDVGDEDAMRGLKVVERRLAWRSFDIVEWFGVVWGWLVEGDIGFDGPTRDIVGILRRVGGSEGGGCRRHG